MRPNLVGGATVLAEAIATAGHKIDVTALLDYAQDLGWAAALRRIGSVADTLEVEGLAGRLHPLKPITADLDLEPGENIPHCWRDAQWHVRWQHTPDEIASVVKQ
jgi:predicted transcriptional regulator of viral defense system